MDADAIVVGGALAGLVAATELIEAGKRVILLDQEPAQALGGQAFWSFGGLFFVDSPEQRRMRIRDSHDLALQDWLGAAADAEYRRTGLPLMRHLALVYPTDAKAVATDDEFLFGPDLLAAPVTEAGATKRRLYVPRGGWVDLWRSVRYDAGTGGLTLGRAKSLAGARTVELPAPLDELPLLVRRGTVLPLLVPDVDTLADYGGGKKQVRLADRANRLDLLAFPYGRISATLADGGRLVSRDRGDRWVLSVTAKRATTYRLQASLTTLKKPFTPCRVAFAGRPLARSAWGYSARTGVLTARFAGTRGRLVVGACQTGS